MKAGRECWQSRRRSTNLPTKLVQNAHLKQFNATYQLVWQSSPFKTPYKVADLFAYLVSFFAFVSQSLAKLGPSCLVKLLKPMRFLAYSCPHKTLTTMPLSFGFCWFLLSFGLLVVSQLVNLSKMILLYHMLFLGLCQIANVAKHLGHWPWIKRRVPKGEEHRDQRRKVKEE